MLNRYYAKLIDGYPAYAPNPIVLTEPIEIDGIMHPAGATLSLSGAAKSHYVQLGYKPVTRSPVPSKEGFYYTEIWTDNGAEIVQSWVEHEAQATTQDYIDALAELGVDVNDAQ